MKKNGIVAYREKLEQVIDNYHDFLGDEAERLCRDHSIPSVKGLQVDLTSIVDEDRLLKVGILGRVKSGKSSLLNALLFGGRSILPKEVYSKVVDEQKQRAYPLVSQNTKVPQPREKGHAHARIYPIRSRKYSARYTE